MNAAEIAAALGGRYRSGEWSRCMCPVHQSNGATLALRDAVVSRRHFFFVAPDWRHVTGTMMAALGGLRGFVGERR